MNSTLPSVAYSIGPSLAKAKPDRRPQKRQAPALVRVAQGAIAMSKRTLRAAQILADAKRMADAITLAEMMSPTEPLDLVWHRIEAKYGVPVSAMWSIRYRSDLKDIWASIYLSLCDAHALIERRQNSKAEHDRHVERLTRRTI